MTRAHGWARWASLSSALALLHGCGFANDGPQLIYNECVEDADNLPGVVAVRDSKDPTGPTLTFTPEAWRGFLATLDSDTIGGSVAG